MIRVKNITKEYRGKRGCTALFDVSLEIRDGEIFGILGAGGAGKSTLLSVLAGLNRPSQGDCWINGRTQGKDQREISRFLGYLQQHPAMREDRSALEWLRYTGSLRNLRNLERGFAVMKHFGIAEGERISRMGRGERRMLSLACAMAHNPRILLLDEPDLYLDPLMQGRLDELLLEEKARGTTMLLTSENYGQLERVCDRIGLMKQGALVNVDETAVMRRERCKSYLITFETVAEARRFLAENKSAKQVSPSQASTRVNGELLPFIRLLGNYQITGLEQQTLSLEEIFNLFYEGSTHA